MTTGRSARRSALTLALLSTLMVAGSSGDVWGDQIARLEFWGRVTAAIFLFAFGASVGSFLNVLVYRLPAGLSVVTPPSRCPLCGHRLHWHENLPVIGWLLLRGKCSACRRPISVQYPLIEAAIGFVFAGLYLVYFAAPAESWLAPIGGPWWRAQGLAFAWPSFFSIAFLVTGLIAMTLIDFRTYTIPIELTRVVTFVGFGAALVQPFMPVAWRAHGLWPVTLPHWGGCAIAFGGLAGTLLAWALLGLGRLAPSFADYNEHVKPDDAVSSYPFARREMRKELAYLVPIVIGLLAGWLVAKATGGSEATPPLWIGSLGFAAIGFLVGGGLLWTIRIVGTLYFDREAMGLGDVHLLAAVGAVLGWKDALWTLGLAPVFALTSVAVGLLVGKILRRKWMEVALGPALAAAAIVRILGRPFLDSSYQAFVAWESSIVDAILHAR
ncbi:MAG: prepilin peptidase [Phycisphaerae bacterium]|nr:prepilin peptidase [Phycisphaerae bacterium]